LSPSITPSNLLNCHTNKTKKNYTVKAFEVEKKNPNFDI